MPQFPDDLRYTAEHEWVRGGDGTAVRVGITDFAQDALGDVVYVSLPEVGEKISAGAACGELESTKSVNDVYAPITGTVTARNDALEGSPDLINTDPYGDGWLIEVTPDEAGDLERLLDAGSYRSQVES